MADPEGGRCGQFYRGDLAAGSGDPLPDQLVSPARLTIFKMLCAVDNKTEYDILNIAFEFTEENYG